MKGRKLLQKDVVLCRFLKYWSFKELLALFAALNEWTVELWTVARLSVK